jgi:hypothetical protein
MKNLIITTILIISGMTLQATIYNVDNKPGKPSGYYSSVIVAINNASAGDTIYIYPSSTSYGNITVTKKLYIFGAGYDGTEGTVSRLSIIYLDTTTTPSSNPSGSEFQGLTVRQIKCSKPNITNITVAGNYLYYNYDDIDLALGCQGWIITNNYISGFLNLRNNSSIIITNNIFNGRSYNSIKSSNSASVVISHNLFMRWNNFDNVYNATISNNIFICNTGTYTGSVMSGNVFTNNISYCSNSVNTYTLPPPGNSGTGNLQNQNPLFVSGPVSGFYDITKDYHLQSTSPGKNAATDSTDIGPYGGSKPFVWGKATSLPMITQMIISNPVINQGNNINVNVKAKKSDL